MLVIGQQERVGQRPAAQRAGHHQSGVNRLRRFNITLRYANRRAVTALATLQRAKGVSAGKRRASPALRVTSVHVLRPRKSRIKQGSAWPRVLRTPAHGTCARRCASRCLRPHRGLRVERLARLRPGQGHAPVSREEVIDAGRRRRPGCDRCALCCPNRVTVRATPRHPVVASTPFPADMVPAGADDRSRLKPNRPTGTRRTACRSGARRLDLRARAGEKGHQGIFWGSPNPCQGVLPPQTRTASRLRTVAGGKSRRVRVFSAITIR